MRAVAGMELLLLASTGATSAAAGVQNPNCDAKIKVDGEHGAEKMFVIPTGWKNKEGYAEVPVVKGAVLPELGGRAYLADSCTAGKYNNTDYARPNLLGKTMTFSTDLAGAGCGCNAAFYLTSMGHNEKVSECFDHYCDANNVCGCSCAEIDIMEANQHAWHSTLHTKTDTDGAASGFGGGGDGWNGPRNWTVKEYGINGSCIDTSKPFDVAVSFPIDKHGVLVAMQVTLSQKKHSCKLQARVDNYASGMKELTHALLDGMTPIISYWSDDGMTWMDGLGDDGKGPCEVDHAEKCADSVKFWGFKIEDLDEKGQDALAKDARAFDKEMEKRYPDSSNPDGSNEWWNDQDNQFDKSNDNEHGGNQWWHPEDGEDKGEEGNNQDGSNQLSHTEQGSHGSKEWDDKDSMGSAIAGSDSWDGSDWATDGLEGGNQWWHPVQGSAGSKEWDNKDSKKSATAGSDGWDDEASSGSLGWSNPGEKTLMQKSEETGSLRGAAGPLGADVGVLIGAASVGCVIMAATAAIVLRRRSAWQVPSGTGVGSLAVTAVSSMGGRSASLQHLRASLSSCDISMGCSEQAA